MRAKGNDTSLQLQLQAVTVAIRDGPHYGIWRTSRSPSLGDGDPVLSLRRPAFGRHLAGPQSSPSRARTRSGEPVDPRAWETAILFSLCDALRSGDIWLAHSHRHREPERDLVPATAVAGAARLAVPLNAAEWTRSRRIALDQAMDAVDRAARHGLLAGGTIEGGRLRADRVEAITPSGVDRMMLDLHRRMPEVRITDMLLDAGEAMGFSDVFTDLRTGSVCRDRIGLLSAVLADGLNLGLKKMAASATTHTHCQLLRTARWHVEDDAYDRALGLIVEAQAALPMARIWGEGLTASSDGQFFPAGGTGEAMNPARARCGSEPGIKAYTHISDQFAPLAVRTIPATAHEAPLAIGLEPMAHDGSLFDGLLSNETGRMVREHYAPSRDIAAQYPVGQWIPVASPTTS